MKTLHAFYDLVLGPISFDFVTWLVRAMKERDDRKCFDLHVVIVPYGQGGVGGFSRDWGGYDEHAARWRLWHIVIASCPLARATVTLAASRAQAKRIANGTDDVWWPEGKAHFMGPLVDAARAGQAIPKLRATEQARRYVSKAVSGRHRFVTLTLRKQGSDPDRNSNVAAWDEMGRYLRQRGHEVLVIEDSNEALAKGCGFEHLDPDIRLAVYEQAAMNLICNNGPQELLKFGAAPFLAFGQAQGGWADHFRKHFHMQPGDQLPWARAADQRLVYRPDTIDVMREEFEIWESATNSA